ncbi:MAG: hypothetical protein PVH96_10005, partial [Gemmatimonadota bacterium]
MTAPSSKLARALLLTPLLACVSLAAHPSDADAQARNRGRGRATLQVDHYVRVVSSAPSMEGQTAQIYVRERAQPGTAMGSRGLEGHVVVFVHGAGTPAEVAFDAPGASWMA